MKTYKFKILKVEENHGMSGLWTVSLYSQELAASITSNLRSMDIYVGEEQGRAWLKLWATAPDALVSISLPV